MPRPRAPGCGARRPIAAAAILLPRAFYPILRPPPAHLLTRNCIRARAPTRRPPHWMGMARRRPPSRSFAPLNAPAPRNAPESSWLPRARSPAAPAGPRARGRPHLRKPRHTKVAHAGVGAPSTPQTRAPRARHPPPDAKSPGRGGAGLHGASK
ncbi:MAG: hypothetical protein J3K34DRAFT_413009 [Monoraphidium minutum]|nr:MAG: hypothetical protein J3K34DRAFT_413009 [Monoraphidium minutum]